MPTPESYARLARIERAQHSLFTRSQAIECRFSAATITRYCRDGRFLVRYPGVYVDAGAARTPLQDALAACLACGPGGVCSHTTAAGVVWALDVPLPDFPHVTVPPGRHPDPDDIEVHRTRRLGRLDVVRHQLVPVTSPMRTACDVASVEPPDVTERVVDGLSVRGSLDPARLLRFLDHPSLRSRPGADVLRELLAYRVGTKASDSELERLYFRLLRAAHLPPPERQYPVRTRRGMRYIDYAYPDAHVAIELDGFEGRTTDRERFRDERVRQNDLERLGWEFRRFTKGDLIENPLEVVVITAEAIGLTPVRWRPVR